MLTISSPAVPDLAIDLRAESIRNAVLAHRDTVAADASSADRWTGVLVCPETVARTHLLRIGHTFPLADAAKAHGELEARRTTGKVIFEVAP
jgi:NADPH:quinone reductase-like Zn-dependent oxidoreductase